MGGMRTRQRRKRSEKQFMLSIIVFSAWVNCKNHFDVAVVVAAFLSFVFYFLDHSLTSCVRGALLFCSTNDFWLVSV